MRLSAEATRELRSMAAARRVTLSTVVSGAWALLLARYSGEEDVVFGVTTSGRPPELEGIERAVGLFINTLPLRVAAEPERPLDDWLRALQSRQVELRRWEAQPPARGAALERRAARPAALREHRGVREPTGRQAGRVSLGLRPSGPRVRRTEQLPAGRSGDPRRAVGAHPRPRRDASDVRGRGADARTSSRRCSRASWSGRRPRCRNRS